MPCAAAERLRQLPQRRRRPGTRPRPRAWRSRCVYRIEQQSGQRFGAAHLIDVLRGKPTDKVAQHGHARLSTFGIGAAISEAQWRTVFRQLVALGHLASEGEYGTLAADRHRRARCCAARSTLRLREASEPTPRAAGARKRGADGRGAGAGKAPPRPLDARRAGALRRAQGLARRRRRGAQPAGLRRLPRRDAGRDGRGLRPARSTSSRRSAASARRSSTPTARTSCGCSPRPDSRPDVSPRRPASSVSSLHAADCQPAMARSDDLPDDALMSAYARGDAAAFEQLYARHQAGLYRFIRRLLGSALAAQTDEVFQDTWLKVVQRARALGAAGRDLSHLAVHPRPSPGDRPAAERAAARSRSTPSRATATSPGSPKPRPGSTGRRPPAPRRRARTWRSGAAPARSCCSASSSCRWRSAAPSCCITTTASPSTRSRARSRSASRPRRRGCATR